jgi:hypothetical protein
VVLRVGEPVDGGVVCCLADNVNALHVRDKGWVNAGGGLGCLGWKPFRSGCLSFGSFVRGRHFVSEKERRARKAINNNNLLKNFFIFSQLKWQFRFYHQISCTASFKTVVYTYV